MQIRNLSVNTQRSYVEQVSRFARHFGQSPLVLGPEEIRAYQVYLTNEKKLAPGSIVTAVSALRFLEHRLANRLGHRDRLDRTSIVTPHAPTPGARTIQRP
jgi:site-specific recombinase XerD